MTKKITFKIDEAGEVHVDVMGTTGSECEQLTRDFENKLGVTSKKTHKDSYYEIDTETIDEEISDGI